MRAISFMLTEPQVLAQTKTVTRRLGWKNLKPGQQLRGVRKCMGLAKGEKQVQLCTIEIVSVRREVLKAMTDDLDYGLAETTLEGFPEGNPHHFPSAFVEMFCASHSGCTPFSEVTRIEFKYV